MSISLLFAAAYTLGDLYSKNELTTVFSSGIPFWRFTFSLLVIGVLSSIFMFFFDDLLVIPTLKIKNDLSRRALKQLVAGNNSDVVIKARNGKLIYSVDYFDNEKKILNGISIIETNEKGEFISQIRAHSASWNDTYWEFSGAFIYQHEGEILRIRPFVSDTSYTEPPEMFRRNTVNIDELRTKDAGLLVVDLRSSGLPYYNAQANYYHRFSFASTSFIVMILSISMGGRFRKNILLMSLFTSLSIAVVYYITEMLSMTMAGLNYISPMTGAWFPVILFIIIGVLLLRSAKT
jgi:lipopolysaccharide export system permease protein